MESWQLQMVQDLFAMCAEVVVEGELDFEEWRGVEKDCEARSLHLGVPWVVGADEENALWELAGILYLGHDHFSCELLCGSQDVWMYDGMLHGGSAVRKESAEAVEQLGTTSKSCMYLYVLMSQVS